MPAAALAQSASHPAKADLPPEDEIWYAGVSQDSNGEWKYLKGASKVQTSEMTITADEIDFNSDTDWAYARGHVRMEHFTSGDIINADRAEYNIKTEEGKFYAVEGTSPAKVMTGIGMLTTTNPFFFKAAWADRIKDRYILHKGFVTDCKMPKPWWTFDSPHFDVVPGDRAIARNAVFHLHGIPILYLPYYYRPLGKSPRQSGFLTPNIGNSSRFGYMIGGGYYWAINRSYDVDYTLQYFTLRGPASTLDFRGKPNAATDFNFNYYTVQDKGVPNGQPGVGQKQGGEQFELTAKTEIWGFTGRLDYNYLSSFLFREAFANAYNSLISSEVSSVGFLQRHFKDDVYVVNIAMQRDQLFEAATLEGQPPDDVIIQKLPSFEFSGRDQQIAAGPLPLWFSFGSSAALLTRQEQSTTNLQTGLVDRIDLEPRVATAFSFKGFSLNPSINFGATDYGKYYSENSTTYTPQPSCGGYPSCPPTPATTAAVAAGELLRKDADFVLDLRLPSLERTFTPPSWMHLGVKLKHVVEAEATYEYVTGVNEFQKIIHFDSTDIVSNTNQLTLSVTNHLYKKDKSGHISDVATWTVTQARYFDPTFGGVVVAGQRTVLLSQEELTPYTFLDGPRDYSPIISNLTVNLNNVFGVTYDAEYDPKRNKFLYHSYDFSARRSKYFGGVGEIAITDDSLLIPQANQLHFSVGMGNNNRRGWNIALTDNYDVLLHRSTYEFVQTSFNTDCCGFSFQLRHINFGIRDENQYLFSFSVANLGTFGSLQKQDRIF